MQHLPLLLIALFLLAYECCFAQNLETLSMEELQEKLAHFDRQQDYESALPIAEKIVEITAKKHGRVDSLTALKIHRLAVVYYNIGDLETALKYYTEAKNIRLKVFGPHHLHYNSSLQSLGIVHEDMGSFEKAKNYYLDAIKGLKKIVGKDHLMYANAVNNLGGLYVNTSEYEDAEPLIIEAMEIRKKKLGATSADYASSLNNLAILYWTIDRYEDAEPLYMQALTIKKDVFGEMSLDYANSLNNLAVLYVDMEKFKEAEPLYAKVLEIYKNILGKDHYDYAMTMNNMADMFFEMKQYKKAEPLFKEALAIRKKSFGADHVDYGVTLNAIAKNYYKMEDYEKAEALYLEGEKVVKKTLGEEHEEYFSVINNLALLYLKTEKFDKAKEYLDLSILVNSVDKDPTLVNKIYKLDDYEFFSDGGIILSLSNYYKLEQAKFKRSNKKADQKRAFTALETSIRIIEKRRNSFNSEEDKLRVLKDMSEKVGSIIKLSFEMAKEESSKPKDSFKHKAFAFAEHNKSVLLADAIKSQRAKSLGDLPDSLALYESELEEYKDYLKKAAEEAESREEQEEIREELNGLNQEIQRFVNSLKDKYPKYHALKYKNITASALDIQNLLDDKSLFIEYFVDDSSTYLFALTQKDIQVYTIALTKKELKGKVKKLRNALSNYQFIINNKDKARAAYIEQAHWFYKKLLAPALDNNPNLESLVIIPDSELGHIPFESFLVEPANQSAGFSDFHYLLKDYEISYNYSATLWKDNKEHPVKSPNGKMLALAADYTPQTDAEHEDVRGKYLVGVRKSLKVLPAAQEEVKVLSKYFGGDFLYGTGANERFFKSEAKNYGIIHLAMHGIMHERVPILSSLVFTENQDSVENNFLQAYEIAHLNLNAELVVLSACETGYGKFKQGEGVLSMARSFMYAGVPSLVVSLWQVNDESTSLIMQAFYDNLSQGMNKAKALREAKLTYISKAEGVVAHPAFWSPFIQIGDSNPIKLDTKGGLASFFKMTKTNGLLLGGLIILLIFFILGKKKRKNITNA